MTGSVYCCIRKSTQAHSTGLILTARHIPALYLAIPTNSGSVLATIFCRDAQISRYCCKAYVHAKFTSTHSGKYGASFRTSYVPPLAHPTLHDFKRYFDIQDRGDHRYPYTRQAMLSLNVLFSSMPVPYVGSCLVYTCQKDCLPFKQFLMLLCQQSRESKVWQYGVQCFQEQKGQQW